MNIEIKEVAEYSLSPKQRGDILDLLKVCFPGYFKDQIFFKQVARERILAYLEGKLVGQSGVEYRAIRMGNQLVTIFGIVDLCVHPDQQGKKIATEILRRMEQKARQNRIDFCMLFADEHNLYLKEGYRLVTNPCTWQGIDEYKSTGLIKNTLGDCMMIKEVSDALTWDESAQIDMLGFIF